MPYCEIKDNKTGEVIKGIDFGGPNLYKVGTEWVYAPLGGTSVTQDAAVKTLAPLGLTSNKIAPWYGNRLIDLHMATLVINALHGLD